MPDDTDPVTEEGSSESGASDDAGVSGAGDDAGASGAGDDAGASGAGDDAGASRTGDGAGGRPCPRCGTGLVRRHCKYICPNHGVVMDCSDTFHLQRE